MTRSRAERTGFDSVQEQVSSVPQPPSRR